MKAVHFDVKTGEEIPAHLVQRAGVVGFISWYRLAKLFYESGEVRENEELLSFQVDDRGICFRMKMKGEEN